MFKLIVAFLLLAVIGSLFSGLFHLFRNQGESDRMVKALTWRVGLSVVLFALLMAGFHLGLIPAHPAPW